MPHKPILKRFLISQVYLEEKILDRLELITDTYTLLFQEDIGTYMLANTDGVVTFYIVATTSREAEELFTRDYDKLINIHSILTSKRY